MEKLFTQALGLTSPWSVTSVDFSPVEGRIDFVVACATKHASCPVCGAPDQPIHDRIERTWQHLNFFQFKAFIRAGLPRVACSSCSKTSQMQAPWTREGSGFTLLMEAFIVALCREMPMAAVARMLGTTGDRIARVLDHHVGQARAKENHVAVTQLAVDERSARRGQRFITLFHDPAERRLLFATPGRKASTFEAFTDDFSAHGGDPEAIKTVSMDMSKAYQAGARKHCPNATLCFDPFHVVALANEALQQVRRAEVKEVSDLKGSRWALLKDAKGWTMNQITLMHHLQRSTLKTARAWRLKEALRDIFATAIDAADAQTRLTAWVSWARRSQLPAFKRLGATIRDHLKGIVEHFRTGLSNGFVEAMNGLIQAAKARARGYATDHRLITMCYLICGKLKHLPTNPWIASDVQTAK
jgi:Transposase and inactivated derivatives